MASSRRPAPDPPERGQSTAARLPDADDRAWHPRALWRQLSPAQLFVGSFLLLIAAGTVGFKVLPGLYTGAPLGWTDALFTATSAVCVTGLIVVDTATYFTTWGQAYILLLIQLGGLGIVSFTSVLIVALGQRLSLRHGALAAGSADVTPDIDYRALTWAIFRFTFGIELVGALALYLCWGADLGWTGAVWPAVFHAVSAFCNAGFSTFSTSLAGFQQNAPLLLVVMALIVVGGLGFLTLEELTLWRRGRREADSGRPPPSGTDHRSGRFRLSTHSQLVLITSGVLIAVGAVAITAFEWTNTLAALPPADRLVNGLFASITTRTAGFNTIDYAAAHPSTNFLTIILMSIGGAPGSTAGGLKVTTFALLGLLAWSRLRGRSTTNFAGRTIPPGTVQRATGLFVLVIGVVVVGLFGYSATELTSLLSPDPHGRFFDHLFEAVSAFNTVGLSMGVTDALTNPGRLLTVVLMFIGRVGPLTVAAALSRAETRSNADVRYAYEDVVVG